MGIVKYRIWGLAAAASALGLAGCAGAPTAQVIDPVFSDEAGTASKALADGRTLGASGPTNAGLEIDWPAGTARRADNSFAIKGNSSGGVDVTVNGRTVSFAASDANRDGFGWRKGNDTVAQTNPNNTEILDPSYSRRAQLWEYNFGDRSTKTAASGFAVVGTETRPEALTAKASATYTGIAIIRGLQKNDPNTQMLIEAGTPWGVVVHGRSGVTLDADFAAKTVSGDIRGLMVASGTASDLGSVQAQPGRIVLEKASINGNGFGGAMSGADGFQSLGTATYSGRFFGTTGREAAGGLNAETDGMVFVGGFHTVQN